MVPSDPVIGIWAGPRVSAAGRAGVWGENLQNGRTCHAEKALRDRR